MNDELRKDVSEYCKQCDVFKEILRELKERREKRDNEMIRVWQSLEKKIGVLWFSILVTVLIATLGWVALGQRSITNLLVTQTGKVAEVATALPYSEKRLDDLEGKVNEVKKLIKNDLDKSSDCTEE